MCRLAAARLTKRNASIEILVPALRQGQPGRGRSTRNLSTRQPVGSQLPLTSKKARENNMNWDRIEGNWKQFRGKVKEQWGKLTDDELDQINGNREQLEGKLQARYGYAKDQVKKDVDDWLNRS
jgi:uncharacterized protein YjbJ (UPF0337 family)